LEREVVSTFHRSVFAFPSDFYDTHSFSETSTLGIFQSGATLGNLTALWIARSASFAPSSDFGGIEGEGLSAALRANRVERAVIIAPALSHYSIQKAASVLGVGEHGVVLVPADTNGRMSGDALRRYVVQCRDRNWKVFAIVAVAGSTDCGSIDALSEIAEVAEEFGIHFHVDAAWGFPLLFSSRHHGLLNGLARADSVTIDGHKQFYLPVGTSLLLLRDPSIARGVEKQAPYMLHQGSGDLGKRSLEGSRPGVALFFHAALSIIGIRGYGRLLEHNMRHARLMARKLECHPRFQLLMEPATNIVVYRYIPAQFGSILGPAQLTKRDNREINEINVRIQEIQAREGNSYVSRTTIDFLTPSHQSIVALRAVVSNPFTTEADIDFVIHDQLRVASKCEVIVPSPPVEVGNRNRRAHGD
jgi:glutamate decarboxylase